MAYLAYDLLTILFKFNFFTFIVLLIFCLFVRCLLRFNFASCRKFFKISSNFAFIAADV